MTTVTVHSATPSKREKIWKFTRKYPPAEGCERNLSTSHKAYTALLTSHIEPKLTSSSSTRSAHRAVLVKEQNHWRLGVSISFFFSQSRKAHQLLLFIEYVLPSGQFKASCFVWSVLVDPPPFSTVFRIHCASELRSVGVVFVHSAGGRFVESFTDSQTNCRSPTVPFVRTGWTLDCFLLTNAAENGALSSWLQPYALVLAFTRRASLLGPRGIPMLGHRRKIHCNRFRASLLSW